MIPQSETRLPQKQWWGGFTNTSESKLSPLSQQKAQVGSIMANIRSQRKSWVSLPSGDWRLEHAV